MKNEKELQMSLRDMRRKKLSAVAAATALGRRGGPLDIIKISRMLNHSDPVIREGTLKNLAELGGRDAAMAVVRCVRDKDPRDGRIAAAKFGQII